MITARSFGCVLELTSFDLCMYQEAVSIGMTTEILHHQVPEAAAYLWEMMTEIQRNQPFYESWYLKVKDHVKELKKLEGFGTEENPIYIED
jgi:hypothetical protein